MMSQSGCTLWCSHARSPPQGCWIRPKTNYVRLQGTTDDHAHTFLVKGIDGPALMRLREADLLDWKLKQADIHLIMKNCTDLKRLDTGRVGWTPGALASEVTMPAPSKPVREFAVI